MKDRIADRFDEHLGVIRLVQQHLAGRIAQTVEMIVHACRDGGGVLLFGNGGSAADAQHFACELVGRFLTERQALRAEALTTDTSILTALANDYGYEKVFVRQLQAKARPGDVAIGLSTSGNSASVVEALRLGRSMGLKTVALTGSGGGQCGELADVLLDVPSDSTPRVQEAHAVICHIICEMVEQAFAARQPGKNRQ